MMLRTIKAKEHEEQVKQSQDRYVSSQVDLIERILEQVKSNSLFDTYYNHDQQLNIALAIYKGYCLTDVEDAIRGRE